MDTSSARRPALERLLLLLVILAAAMLRGWRLDGMSIWQDEGLSLYRATQPLAGILSGIIPLGAFPTHDVHPPFYFLVLGGWFRLAGATTWTAKWFSLLAGLPALPLLWALARRLFGRKGHGGGVGLLAAGLAAASPLYLWYSQEIRNYTWITTLGLLAVYALVRALAAAGGAEPASGGPEPASGDDESEDEASGRAEPASGDDESEDGASGDADGEAAGPGVAGSGVPTSGVAASWPGASRWGILCLAANAALVWSHYLGFFLVAFEIVAVCVHVVLRSRRTGEREWAPWLAVLGALGLTVLPLLPFGLNRLGLGPETNQHTVPLDVWLQDIVRGYGVGLTARPEWLPWHMAVSTALLLLGVRVTWRRRRGAALWLVGYLALPILLFFLVAQYKPVYLGVQHLILESPPYYLLVAAAFVLPFSRLLGATGAPSSRTRRHLVAGGLGILLGLELAGMAVADTNFYNVTEFQKDDLRGLAEYVDQRAAPGDVLAVSDPVYQLAFAQLVRRVPVIILPAMEPNGLRDERPPAAQLEPILAKGRLWYMRPDDDLRDWLDQHAQTVDERSFEGRTLPVRLAAFEKSIADPTRDLPKRATWTAELGGLNLLGFDTLPAPLVAGQGARVRLAWQVADRALPDYKVAVKLLDADGRDFGQGDQEPYHGLRPTSTWPFGEITYSVQDLLVGPETPPGEYRLAIVVYDPATGATFPAGGPFVMGSVQVVHPPTPILPEAAGMQHAVGATVGGGWVIVGYDVTHGRQTPGQPLPVAVWLQAEQPLPMARTVRLELVDAWGRVAASADGAVPVRRMRPGDLRRATISLHLPPDAGHYGLRVRLLGSTAPESDTPGQPIWLRRGLLPLTALWLDSVELVAPPQQTAETLAIPFASDAKFGDFAELAGYDLPTAPPTAGAELPVALFWRAVGAVPADYQVTVQLLPIAPVSGGGEAADIPNGPPVAQHDGTPADGARPSTGWRAGEVVEDRHTLRLPPDLKPGTYLLVAALYDPKAPGAPRPEVEQGGAKRDFAVLRRVEVGR